MGLFPTLAFTWNTKVKYLAKGTAVLVYCVVFVALDYSKLVQQNPTFCTLGEIKVCLHMGFLKSKQVAFVL